jgi:uncharacterized protein DUF6615
MAATPKISASATPVASQPSPPLCVTFQERAVATWDYVVTAAAAGFDAREETLTENNLVEVYRRHPVEVRLRKFSPHVESRRSGADWEWWIGGRAGWLGLRIQAKRLNRGLRYETLAYQSRNGRQVDLLRASSAADGLVPLYCFYNAWHPTALIGPWRCPTVQPQAQLLGCSMAPASLILPLIDARPPRDQLLDVLPLCFPWSCIVCCHGFAEGGASLPQRVRAFLSAADPDSGNVAVRETPPSYVTEVLELPTGARLTPSRRRRPDLSELFIMREVEIGAV